MVVADVLDYMPLYLVYTWYMELVLTFTSPLRITTDVRGGSSWPGEKHLYWTNDYGPGSLFVMHGTTL